MPNFRVVYVPWQAAGHTQIHTHFHLYIVDALDECTELKTLVYGSLLLTQLLIFLMVRNSHSVSATSP
jgi:hypothetical protein